jgi:hypothetical protein
MSHHGDDVLAEYDVDVTSPERLKAIENEFNGLMQNGYTAADITDKKDEIIHQFDPTADILLIPRMQGGIA